LSDLVSGMGELLKRALGIEVDLVCQFPKSLSPVLVDSNQLELALLNLALNARDAMPSGGTLTIRAAEEVIGKSSPGDTALGAGDYVRVGVSDTGVGMDEATRAKATDPFFTTKGPGKGTGLGLSMVHGLAAQSGGQLRIVSTPGVGTTVELWLPRAKTDAVSLVRSAERPAPLPPPATASWRVLIVDDDLLVLTGTAALIEDLGHVAIEVPSAAEALAVLDSGQAIDVIVTDHAMPNMTGLQLAHSVQEKYPGLPIVLATGYAELPADPAEFGVVKLAKPCSQSEIAAALQTAMGFARRDTLRAARS
jgi:CheY-like chemotaxis protein